jgi:hypothetical protein
MRARQQLLRALIADIIADVDEATREVILTVHWRGGQHSQLRVRKPKSGEHGCRTPEEALAVMARMAARWCDTDIAASLNRMGIPTGQGKTWTAHRVASIRKVHGMHAYRSAEKNGAWLTMSEAAAKLGVTNHVIRRLIKARILVAEQVVPGAIPDPGSRSRDRAGNRGHRSQARPVSPGSGEPTRILSKHLRKGGIMNASSRWRACRAWRRCCRIRGRSYGWSWVTRPDQAARVSASSTATPSENLMPSTTRGNWHAPFSRHHFLRGGEDQGEAHQAS